PRGCMLCRFALLKYAKRHTLHRFPTRRSSDLTNAIRIVEQKKIPYQEHTYTFSENDLGAKHVAEELNQNEAQIFKTLVTVGNKTDRKSTRLNSSHVSISYAVFCLKNKAKTECE